MKTIPLRQLVREPLKVKRWTRAGKAVRVTDKGKPLWVIQPAALEEEDESRRHAIDDVLDEVLCQTSSKMRLSEIIVRSRR